MQQTWGTGILQRRKYHQKHPDGSKGQRSHHKEEWHHLQDLNAAGWTVMMNT